MNSVVVEILFVTAAAGPLAVYFIWLGAVNSGRHPRMVSGSLDLAALLLGFVGLVAVGPGLALGQAHIDPVSLVGLALVGVAWLSLAAVRHVGGYVVYNIDGARFWAALESVLTDLGHAYRRRRGRIEFEDLDMHVHVDAFEPLRNVTFQIQHEGAAQEAAELAARLRRQLGQVDSGPSLGGGLFLVIGSGVLLFPVFVGLQTAMFGA